MIYFDNAATTGTKPEQVINAVNTALKHYSVNPGRAGYGLSQRCSETIYRCRKETAEFFGSSGPQSVIFTPNCTASVNYVLKGVLKSGDHIIVSSQEHNSVMRPLYELSKRGVEVDSAEVIFGDDDATVRTFANLIKGNTKMIFCIHASNVIGNVLPIKQIGELCAEKGIAFGVDAAQTAGIIGINMKEMNIDYLCIAPHKGLYAPTGTGILIADKPIEKTVIEGGTGTDSLLAAQPKDIPEGFESGTVNVSGIFGIKAGLDFVKQKGMKNLYRKEMELAAKVYDNLSKISGVVLYSQRPEIGSHVPTLSFNIKGLDSTDVADKLDKKGICVRAGLHCAPSVHRRLGTVSTGTVRVSFSAFNNWAEVQQFCNAISEISRMTEKRPYFY